MFDLFLLLLPPALGFFVYDSLLAPVWGFEKLRWTPSPGPALPPRRDFPLLGYAGPSDEDIALYSAIQAEAKRDAVAMAVKAMDALPDASPDSIADALGLPAVSVRTRSRAGSRVRKAGRHGDKTADYSRNEVLAAATGNNDCHVDW